MKKLLVLFSLICFVFFSQAQVVRTLAPMVEQSFKQSFNFTKLDTIASGQTLSYVVNLRHNSDVYPIIDQRMTVVSADTTVILTLWESMDNITYHRVKYNNSGSEGDYAAKTLAKGSTAVSYITTIGGANFCMPYLKLVYTAPTKTGFKKVLFGYIQFIKK